MSADFGANDWLVEEMYERYQADPNSVEPSWIQFFKTYNSDSSTAAPVTTPPKAGIPPIPKSVQKNSQVATVVSTPVAEVPVFETAAELATPTPAQAQIVPAPVISVPNAGTMEALRGVAGRVVASMEASLSVPTATSVRAIPVKLMIDNRTVITNHLKRTRG